MLVGKPKEEALRTAHGVPTAPPPDQSSAQKADPAVKAPHVGSLPHFMGSSEENAQSVPSALQGQPVLPYSMVDLWGLLSFLFLSLLLFPRSLGCWGCGRT